jgi:hypothetical protein
MFAGGILKRANMSWMENSIIMVSVNKQNEQSYSQRQQTTALQLSLHHPA